MKTCPKCGNTMGDMDRFCISCGARLEEAAVSGTPINNFCFNCGEKLEEDAVFCPNCGTNLQEEPSGAPAPIAEQKAGPVLAKAGLKSGKTGKLVAAAAGAAVVVLGALAVGGLFRSPSRTFVSGQKEFFLEAAMKYVTEAAEQYNAGTDISTDMVLSASANESEAAVFLDGSSLGIKMDCQDNNYLINFDLTVMDEPLLTGAMTYGDGVLGFCIPELDDTYYTIEMEALYDALGVSYTDGMPVLEGAPDLPDIDVKTLRVLAERYLDVVLSAANKDNVTKADKNSFRLEEIGKSLDGNLYIFEPTAEDVEEMILKLADTLEEDEELRSFVIDFVGSNAEWIDENTGFDVTTDWDEAILDAADELRDNAADIGESVEDSEFRWLLGISDKKVCYNAIEVQDGDIVVAYERNSTHYMLYAANYGNVMGFVDLDYKEEGKKYSGSLTVGNNYTELALDFDEVDKESKSVLGLYHGTYEMGLPGNMQLQLELEVEKATDGGTDHILSLFAYNGWTEIMLHTTDKESTAVIPDGKPEDISDYSREEFADLFYRMGESAQELINDSVLSMVTGGGF